MNKTNDIKLKAYLSPREFLAPEKIKTEFLNAGIDRLLLLAAIKDGMSEAAVQLWSKAERLKKWRLIWGILFYGSAMLLPACGLSYDFYRYLPIAIMAIGVCHYLVSEEIHKIESSRDILMSARNLYDENGA